MCSLHDKHFWVFKLGLGQDFVDKVTEENDLEKSVGGLFMPERVWRVSSALVITWVDVVGVHNVHISLWNFGDSSGEFVEVWSKLSSEVENDWVVKESKWDEELLPGESPSDLNNHTNESHSEFYGILMGNSDVFNSRAKLWKEVIINELS